MSMQLNPEFRRQLWLQISATRLILAPVVIAIVVAVLVAIEPSDAGTIHRTAWFALVVVVIFWGTSVAGTSIRDEITGRTWNQQRMSRLTPWQLTWGKMFGATSYVWYVALLCALVVAFTFHQKVAAESDSGAVEFFILLALGLFAHSVAIMAPLAFQTGSETPLVSVPSIVVFALVIIVVKMVSLDLQSSEYGIRKIRWFGLESAPQLFSVLLAACIAAWGVLGAWRATRQALQVRQIPWALPAFVAFVGVWIAGTTYMEDRSIGTSALIGATLALAASAWVLMLWEPQSLYTWQRIRAHWAAGERSRSIAGVSAATSVVLFAVMGALLVAVMNATATLAEVAGVRPVGFMIKTAMSSKLDLASHSGAFLWLALVLLRDFAYTLLADTFTTSPRRRSAVILLYLLFMYVAVPAALQAVSSDSGEWWLPTSSAVVPMILALVTLLAMLGALISRMPRTVTVIATKS